MQAAWLGELVERLDAAPIAIAGWHQGSVVALELGLMRPDLCPALIFDGAGTHDVPSAQAIVRTVIAHLPATPRDQDPRGWWMDLVLGRIRLFNPHFTLDAATWPVFERLLLGMLQVDPAIGQAASPMVPPEARGANASGVDVPYYDWPARLAAWRRPLLILSAEDEPLRPSHDIACAVAPDAAAHVFAGGHPLIGVGREEDYVAPIAAFLGTLS
jgi:pimeloyl-ACP methyl ester carboxylesterase